MGVMNGFILSSNLEKLLNLFSQNCEMKRITTAIKNPGRLRPGFFYPCLLLRFCYNMLMHLAQVVFPFTSFFVYIWFSL